jgi:hypothetical protein
LVAVVPGCATRRLADELLTHSATELFAAPTNQNESEPRGDVGFIGVWPFLEVTAPAMFRVRLREGLASSDPAIRDQCGELLLRLHDAGSAAALASWMPENSDDSWLLLARCGAPARDALTARLRDEKGSERWDPFAARDLAVALGMPFELAEGFRFDNEPQPGQLASLLAGDAASAFLAAVAARTDLTGSELLPAVSWNDARVQAAVRPRLERAAAEDANFQLALGVARRDPATLATVRELLADGRYATHHIPTRGVLTLGHDRSMLAFWIDEYGANCCRRCNTEEAMSELFYPNGGEEWDQEGEPTGVRLRRLLLPKQDRLRWSELAHGYVVAGR